MIYGRRPMTSQKITITAQGRTDSNQNTGISIQNSRIMAASDLKPVLGSFKTFLGWPWKQYSLTVFSKNYMDSLVDPAGWLEWDANFALNLNTLYYGEYRNTGPGSSTSRSVKWRGTRTRLLGLPLRTSSRASRGCQTPVCHSMVDFKF
ncbi:putative pectinesterase [Helianthus annuus]|uniref:Pectinesterase n=1 Tax=Helianthus annuus TaxID=4232 RepID=A0A251UFR0_HELAN|nr:putative pectinesterase [Helianthus annuus]